MYYEATNEYEAKVQPGYCAVPRGIEGGQPPKEAQNYIYLIEGVIRNNAFIKGFSSTFSAALVSGPILPLAGALSPSDSSKFGGKPKKWVSFGV